MSTVIDFFHDDSKRKLDKRYLIRLRGNSNGIIDLAGNQWSNTNVTAVSDLNFIQNGASLYFNGSAYLTMNDPSKNIGTGDFTISFWCQQNNPKTYSHMGLAIYDSLVIWVYNPEPRGSSGIASTSEWIMTNLTKSMFNVGSKTHIAFVRHNGINTIYVNGEASQSRNDWLGNQSLQNVAIGVQLPSMRNSKLYGYMDDICVIKDLAVWTENFTPPTDYLPDNL